MTIEEISYEIKTSFGPPININNLDKSIFTIKSPPDQDMDVYLKTSSHEYFLYLKDNGVLLGSDTPIYRAKYNVHNKRVQYTKTFYRDYFPGTLKLYHDYEYQAAFAVHTDENGRRHFDGVIGENVHIRSIPERLHKELERNASALFETSADITDSPWNSNMVNSTYHVIIDKSNDTSNDARKNQSNDPNTLGANSNNAKEAKIRPPPQIREHATVYPEILITLDYETFGLHGWDIKKTAKYMAAFWNAVDLRFRELTDPQVRLNIAGLIIPEDAMSVPYKMAESKLPDGSYDGEKLLNATRTFFAVNETRTFPFDSYDVIVSMTPEKLSYDYGRLKGIAADFKGACKPETRFAMFKDHGYFSGTLTATHELGHLFGAHHDFFSSGCASLFHKFIMTPGLASSVFRWSRCSKEAMKDFFNSEDSHCLKNKPYVGSPYPKILPGTLQSLNERCLRRSSNASAVFTEDLYAARNYTQHLNDCITLECQVGDRWIDGKIVPVYAKMTIDDLTEAPAEGSSCGINKICLDGYCVDDSPSYHSTNPVWNQ